LADSQQHQDAERQLRLQKNGSVVIGALITAGLALLGWMASTLYDMNGTLASMSQQLGTALEVQQRQQDEIDTNAGQIRENADQIQDNANRIERNRRTLNRMEQTGAQGQ
jgi:hypothetical protein